MQTGSLAGLTGYDSLFEPWPWRPAPWDHPWEPLHWSNGLGVW